MMVSSGVIVFQKNISEDVILGVIGMFANPEKAYSKKTKTEEAWLWLDAKKSVSVEEMDRAVMSAAEEACVKSLAIDCGPDRNGARYFYNYNRAVNSLVRRCDRETQSYCILAKGEEDGMQHSA